MFSDSVAVHFRDVVALVLFFSPDLSKLIMARQSESPLYWSFGPVTLTLFFFFQLATVRCPEFPRDALIPTLCLNLSGKMEEWLRFLMVHRHSFVLFLPLLLFFTMSI